VRKLKKGRQMTPVGQAFLDNIAHSVRSKMQKATESPAQEPVAESAT